MQQKFRAWDRLRKRISVVDRIYFDTEGVQMRDDGGLYWRHFREVVLMQSTGIKDINGQEIFEGDLIKTSSAVCLVDFGEYTYLEDDETEITAIGFYLAFLNIHPVSCCPFESLFWKGCEVIGNIHENELDLIMYEAWKFNKVVADDTKI